LKDNKVVVKSNTEITALEYVATSFTKMNTINSIFLENTQFLQIYQKYLLISYFPAEVPFTYIFILQRALVQYPRRRWPGLGLSDLILDHHQKTFSFRQEKRPKMSFLLPVLRQTVRLNLRNTTNLLHQQHIHRIPRTIPLTSTYLRAYSQNNDRKPSSENTSQPEQSDPSNATKESLEDPLAPESSIPPESKTVKDPFSGDINAAPGSILSQYTSAPTEVAQLDSESSSGLPKKDEYISSADRKRDSVSRVASWGFIAFFLAGAVYLGRPLDDEERQRLGWGEVSPLID
jgi:hypothetical protein